MIYMEREKEREREREILKAENTRSVYISPEKRTGYKM